MSMTVCRGPSWDRWLVNPKPTIRELVALSLNIDPDSMFPNIKKDLWMANFIIGGLESFADRVRIACENHREINGERAHPNRADVLDDATLNLNRFVRWAKLQGWGVPPELTAIALLHSGISEGLRMNPSQAQAEMVDRPHRAALRQTSGFMAVDRKTFPEIRRMMNAGARSAYGAALILAENNNLAGGGTPKSQAKRVSKLFRTEELVPDNR